MTSNSDYLIQTLAPGRLPKLPNNVQNANQFKIFANASTLGKQTIFDTTRLATKTTKFYSNFIQQFKIIVVIILN